MKIKALVIALAALAVSTAAQAHAPKVGHNGGPQADAGSFHVEVVPKGKALQVFLRDHGDKAVSTAGFKGTAVFVIDGKPQRINLAPAGENTLKGEAEVELPAQPKGAVQITTKAGSTVQAKF
ncbi:MAG TPA: hypothetical protein VNR11_15900 [Xanthobacteraceae bacterium]|nr:hypothetical protein [Xanthobacteraceae bacterium]